MSTGSPCDEAFPVDWNSRRGARPGKGPGRFDAQHHASARSEAETFRKWLVDRARSPRCRPGGGTRASFQKESSTPATWTPFHSHASRPRARYGFRWFPAKTAEAFASSLVARFAAQKRSPAVRAQEISPRRVPALARRPGTHGIADGQGTAAHRRGQGNACQDAEIEPAVVTAAIASRVSRASLPGGRVSSRSSLSSIQPRRHLAVVGDQDEVKHFPLRKFPAAGSIKLRALASSSALRSVPRRPAGPPCRLIKARTTATRCRSPPEESGREPCPGDPRGRSRPSRSAGSGLRFLPIFYRSQGECRGEHVFQRAALRQKVMELENKPDGFAAQPGQLIHRPAGLRVRCSADLDGAISKGGPGCRGC